MTRGVACWLHARTTGCGGCFPCLLAEVHAAGTHHWLRCMLHSLAVPLPGEQLPGECRTQLSKSAMMQQPAAAANRAEAAW